MSLRSGQTLRTKGERELDLVDIAHLYVKGTTQQAIADWIKANRPYSISRQMVAQDIALIRKHWQREASGLLSEKKAAELARIDNLEREYWQAWERSCATARKTRKGARELGQVQVKTAQVEEWGRDGDPRFLEGVRWCIAQRCKILGLEIVRQEVSGPNGKPIAHEHKDRSASFDWDAYRRLCAQFAQNAGGNGHGESVHPAPADAEASPVSRIGLS